MNNGFFSVPKPINDPILHYKKGSEERKKVLDAYKQMWNNPIDVPLYIGAKKISTKQKGRMAPPHNHQHTLGTYSLAEAAHVQQAIDAALEAKEAWENTSFEHRASVF